jgi:pyruvate,water dikinase
MNIISTKWLSEVNLSNINLVGGKNASLGEMLSNLQELNIKVPNGFVITTDAYSYFLKYNNLDSSIHNILSNINYNDNTKLRRDAQQIRRLIQNGTFPIDLQNDILEKYYQLSQLYNDVNGDKQTETDVAVRSSATTEDLSEVSFAGQQDTYLNVRGESQLMERIKSCFASIFNERAIDYRHNVHFDTTTIKLSVCVQKMVRSDLASAGVAFSIDTESGNKSVIVINSSYGLGEMVVSGQVQPDEFIVFKPTLNEGYKSIIDKTLGNKLEKMIYSDNQDKRTKTISISQDDYHKFSLTDGHILQLAEWVSTLEKYYSNKHKKWCPVDVEWAIDGLTNEMYIVQCRPETIHSNKNQNILTTYTLTEKNVKPILNGIAIGDKISSGCVKTILSLDSRQHHLEFNDGDILVTEITDPDWEPIMKKASAIITERGGRTCHAAIIARELGIPTIVGVIGATKILKNGQMITVNCADGEVGHIYNSKLEYQKTDLILDDIKMPENTKIMMNVASPEKAFQFAKIPNCGVGLARLEFIINNTLQVHPLALLHPEKIDNPQIFEKIDDLSNSFEDPIEFFINKLAYGIAKIGAAFYPNNVIVRFSDFKSNEYKNLLGGSYFEPHEENPMIGWRGASRYYSKEYEAAFGLECAAIKKVREEMGLQNVIVMIPFCRTVEECQKVLAVMEKYGLKRGENGLQVYLMCEIPSNVILVDEFCKYIDGYSIGSNDLTQLTLGLDRDSELVAHIYTEQNSAVKQLISMAIQGCKRNGKKIGLCGQCPSDFPEFAKFLIDEGIDSISLVPDSVIKTIMTLNQMM